MIFNVNCGAASSTAIGEWSVVQPIPRDINIASGITGYLKKNYINMKMIRNKHFKFINFKLNIATVPEKNDK